VAGAGSLAGGAEAGMRKLRIRPASRLIANRVAALSALLSFGTAPASGNVQ